MPIPTITQITQEFLKSRLDRRNNRFYWKLVPVTRWQDKSWNTRLAGKMAGHLNKTGYRSIRFKIGGKKPIFLEHRLVWLWIHGHFPEDQIDHIDHVRDNNSIENLRAVDSAENGKNIRMPKDNTSGIIGVCWHKSVQKWLAQIKVDDKQTYLGIFDDKFEAICARKSAEIKYGYHPNHGRSS